MWPQVAPLDETMKVKAHVKPEDKDFDSNIGCFYTKMSIDENVLGFGVSVTGYYDSGVIQNVMSTFDILSLRAYLKETRISLNNESFTYFIPLYFGKEKERTLKYAEKALSIICKDVSNGFEPTLVLEVLPKILSTLVLDIAGDVIYYTENNLGFFIFVFGLFHLFVERYPELMDMMNEHIEKFISSEENGTKEVTMNLGDLLIYSMMSNQYRWEDLRDYYVVEQLDRQVLWLLREIPELELSEFNEFDAVGAKASFSVGKVGFGYCSFMSHMSGMAKPGDLRSPTEENARLLDLLD